MKNMYLKVLQIILSVPGAFVLHLQAEFGR